MEKTTPKADQRKGELLIRFLAWKKWEIITNCAHENLQFFSAFRLFFIICLFQRNFHLWGKTEKPRLGLFWRTFSCSCFSGCIFLLLLLPAAAVFLVCSEHFLGELSKIESLETSLGENKVFFKVLYIFIDLSWSHMKRDFWEIFSFTRLYSLAIEGSKSLVNVEGFVFFFPFAHSKIKKRKPRERLTYSKLRLFTCFFHSNCS